MPPIIQGEFTGIGEPPQLLSAQSREGGMVVRLLFSEAMDPSSALVDPMSYIVLEEPGSVAVSILSVSVVAIDTVDLTLNRRLTNGTDNYVAEVDPVLEDLAGNEMDPLHVSVPLSGESILPKITSISVSIPETVRVHFDSLMYPDSLTDLDTYDIDPIPGYPAVTILWASPEAGDNPTYVDLLLDDPLELGHSNYILSLSSPLPTDQSLNPIDPEFHTLAFPLEVEDIYDGPKMPDLSQGAQNPKRAEWILWRHLSGVMPK